jgi:hypothetical protein
MREAMLNQVVQFHVTDASTARALRFTGRNQLLPDISDVCAEMAGDRIEVDILARSARATGTTQPTAIASSVFESREFGKKFELARRVRALQKLIVERSAITHAFGRRPSPGLRTPPPGRMMYCISG